MNKIVYTKAFSKLSVIVFALFMVVACSKEEQPQPQPQEPSQPVTPVQPITVEEFMGKLTLEQKVGQMFIVAPEYFNEFRSSNAAVTALDDNMFQIYQQYPVGGFCLFAQNIKTPYQTSTLTGNMHNLNPAPLICVDEEGGRVARLARNANFGLTQYESMAAIGATGDTLQAYNAGKYIGGYLKNNGFDINFAPVADVNTNPDNIVIGDRAFSDNPLVAAPMVVNFVKGMWTTGTTGCLKHFPGHGDTKEDTHYDYASSNKSWEEMLGCEMITFKRGIDAGVQMIMTAHIAAPRVTGDDLPSTMSPVMLQEKLRGELGFKGIIITDAMGMAAIADKYTTAQATVNAIVAGVDIILMPPSYKDAFDGVMDAIKKGTITEERINESVVKILTLKHSKKLLR